MTEQFDAIKNETVQSVAKRTDGGFSALLLASLWATGYMAPAWPSKRRDVYLRSKVKESDFLSGAVNNLCARIAAIPSHVEARDPTVKAHVKLADEYNIVWNELSDFAKGKQSLIYKLCQDWFTQDNGMFIEIIGAGEKDKPIEGPALAVAHLDSYRCYRTGNVDYPVVYMDTSGKRYKLHRTRVAYASSMPSTQEEVFDYGFCAVSRALNNVQHLIDIAVFEQEKLGSRPRRQLLITQGGLDPEDVALALQMADSKMDNEGLSRYSKAILLGDSSLPDAALATIDLASIPDGFDKQSSITLGMFAIALAFGVPVRWLWPATQAGATKADAMYSHIAGQGPGVGYFLETLTNLLAGQVEGLIHLAGKFLPPQLKLIFDFQDDEQDRSVAEIKKLRAEGWQIHLQNATMDTRTVREQMLSNGDLTESQFRRLELENGRLPDGRDVLALFTATDDLTMRLLDLGVENPLAIATNDPVTMLGEIDAAAIEAQDAATNANSITQRKTAEEALAALGKLKGIYTDILTQQVQAEVTAEATEEKPTEEPVTKQFNYGAGVGEIIAGKLARGAGGQFINVEELKAQIRAGIMARLQGGGNAQGLTKAELKRLQNREGVAEMLPGAADSIDALALLRGGEQPNAESAQELVDRGLATIGEDGTVISTPKGRSLIRAANSGDIDAARAALQQKPKKAGKAGGKGGKTAQDRENERLLERNKNREAVRESLDIAAFDSLMKFDDGQEISGDDARSLANNGLVEFDTDGKPRLTAQGKTLTRAADKGDTRSAQDAVSVAREKVAKTEEKATAALERANNIDTRISELSEALNPENPSYDPEKVESVSEKITQLQEQAAQQREQAQALLNRIGKGQENKELVYKAALDDYQLSVRAAFRRLWAGLTSEYEFTDEMVSTMTRGLHRAWNQGAAVCGIKEDELSEDEINARDDLINSQFEYLPGVAAWIVQKRQEYVLAGKTPNVRNMTTMLYTRAAMWVNRFREAENKAKAMACADFKAQWRRGPTSESCSTCAGFDGRVYRFSTWQKYGALPGVHALACHGFKCLCSLEKTDLPITKGPFPKGLLV